MGWSRRAGNSLYGRRHQSRSSALLAVRRNRLQRTFQQLLKHPHRPSPDAPPKDQEKTSSLSYRIPSVTGRYQADGDARIQPGDGEGRGGPTRTGEKEDCNGAGAAEKYID